MLPMSVDGRNQADDRVNHKDEEVRRPPRVAEPTEGNTRPWNRHVPQVLDQVLRNCNSCNIKLRSCTVLSELLTDYDVRPDEVRSNLNQRGVPTNASFSPLESFRCDNVVLPTSRR